MIGAVTAFKTRPNFRRRQSGWERNRDKQLISTRFFGAIINHRNAVHEGNHDSNCPACKDLLKKAGAEEI